MIHIEPGHYKIIQDILRRYSGYEFYAFGSRVTGTHKKFSDLDICVMGKLSTRDWGDLDEAFRASRLPYKVDVVIWERCSEEFRRLIHDDMKKIEVY